MSCGGATLRRSAPKWSSACGRACSIAGIFQERGRRDLAHAGPEHHQQHRRQRPRGRRDRRTSPWACARRPWPASASPSPTASSRRAQAATAPRSVRFCHRPPARLLMTSAPGTFRYRGRVCRDVARLRPGQRASFTVHAIPASSAGGRTLRLRATATAPDARPAPARIASRWWRRASPGPARARARGRARARPPPGAPLQPSRSRAAASARGSARSRA